MGFDPSQRAGWEQGAVVYTGMLNSRGGYETDVTVTRLGEDEYMVVSPTSQATRDMDWMRRNNNNSSEDGVAIITDVTRYLP